MATFSIDGVTLRAVAAAVPRHVESNLNDDRLSPQERAILVKTTGIEERRVAGPTLTTADLCAHAADELLKRCRIDRDSIGLLVFVSQSEDYYLPATAALLQHRLGLSTRTMAFDVGLGCSGYVYGLSIVASLLRNGGIGKALLLTGDVSTITVSPEDKSTWPLFGDAGTATLIEATPGTSPWHFNFMTDGGGADAIIIPDGGARNKINEKSLCVDTVAEGVRRHRLHLVLNGADIFAFATREVPALVRALAEYCGRPPDSMDYFVMHQANKLMNETIRKKLGIAAEKTPYSLDQFGNTSSASIPLTMVTRMREDLESRPLELLLSGFGVGLSCGNVFLPTPPLTCLPLLEVQ